MLPLDKNGIEIIIPTHYLNNLIISSLVVSVNSESMLL